MKILYHHRTRGGDAQGIHIREIVKGMRQLGHEVEIAALVGEDPRGAGNPGREGESGGRKNALLYEIMTLAYNPYGFAMLARAIRRFRPDMIYERYSLNTFCGILASRRYGIPIVLEVNAPLSYEQATYDRLAFPTVARRLERWICSNATKTIAVSHVLKGMLRDIGIPADKMVVIPNGIDPQEFHPGISGDPVRGKWGLSGKVVLGFSGWFRKWHGVGSIIDILAEEFREDGRVHLLLVGDGPAMGELRSRVGKLGLESRVAFTGAVGRKEMPAHVAAFDVALQPDVTPYASPVKIFEYMGMGKCIVAPGQPNIREILADGETGLLFTPGDRESMKAALRRAVVEESLRRTIGDAARRAVDERGYLWRANAEKAIALAAGTGGLA